MVVTPAQRREFSEQLKSHADELHAKRFEELLRRSSKLGGAWFDEVDEVPRVKEIFAKLYKGVAEASNVPVLLFAPWTSHGTSKAVATAISDNSFPNFVFRRSRDGSTEETAGQEGR
jgi:hypothetical protein